MRKVIDYHVVEMSDSIDLRERVLYWVNTFGYELLGGVSVNPHNYKCMQALVKYEYNERITTKHIVVKNKDLGKLGIIIKNYLEKGYKLQDGIIDIENNNRILYYAQALVKYEDNE